ncbi:porin [Nitrosomonas sp.]|uniref:OprO/OprP family phosphate-selective porin n=1 Tax=Nitrosomonas sp. TaxID=42353 RepID=UPI002851F39F|nr:porin [Nitrosomonas sp.]MDR4513078.1 porin [Nitrosomonas sp.]
MINLLLPVAAGLIILNAVLPSAALAMDVYVDTQTKQLFIEPGPGRKRIGTLKLENSDHLPSSEATGSNEQPQSKKIETVKTLPPEGVVSVKHGDDGVFRLETEDGDFSFRLGGRIHADATFSDGDSFIDTSGNRIEANDGTEIRRGRLKFEGTFFKDWFFKSEVDFADNRVAIKDMFMQYYGFGFARIRVGEQKQAFSRELQESSNDLLFLERSVMNVLNAPTVDRALGLNIFAHGPNVFGIGQNWTGQVGIYGDTIDANKRNTFADEGWAVNSRMTFAPIAKKERVIHMGVAGNYREPNDAGDVNDVPLTLAYETTHMSNLNLIKTAVPDINHIAMLGIEGHGLLGPFSAGGEYTHSWMDVKGSSDLSFHGWYTEAAWTLTGESRVYRKGLFYRVIPENTFSLTKGGWGAWELAVRYGEIDLNDGAFKGGKLGNFTAGLNWYPNRIMRFMASYDHALRINHASIKERDGNKADGLNTFMFRAQMAF